MCVSGCVVCGVGCVRATAFIILPAVSWLVWFSVSVPPLLSVRLSR